MLYDAISKGRVYKNQSVINYPIGAKKNYGELAIICAPSWKKSLQFINNPINRWYLMVINATLCKPNTDKRLALKM